MSKVIPRLLFVTDNLPNDIWYEIIQYLSPRTRLSLECINKHLYKTLWSKNFQCVLFVIMITFIIEKNGFPVSSTKIAISPYDSLDTFVERKGKLSSWLYSDNIVLYVNDRDELSVNSLKNQPVKLEIRNNKNNLDDINVGDVIINGISLIDQISTSVYNA
jgi:hypothetical protein